MASAAVNMVFSFGDVHRRILAFVLVHDSPGWRWSRKKHWQARTVRRPLNISSLKVSMPKRMLKPPWLGGCSQSCGCCRSHNREDACQDCNCIPCFDGWILTTINKDWFATVRWFANTEYPEEQNLRQLAQNVFPERVSAQATHEIVG